MSISSKQNKQLSLIVELAGRLEADIVKRQLIPGASYMTTLEASKFLGVAGASANRALQLLEKRQIIRRSQKSGAIIIEPPHPGAVPIDHVRFVVHSQYYMTEGVGGDGILLGIQSELPTSIVSHCFLTPENENRQVSSLVGQTLNESTTDAFVLVRASYETQKTIADSDLPAVVYGGVYPGIEGLSQIDRDHVSAIRLIIEYLQKQDCSRIAVLMRQQVMPGDHQTLDTLLEMSAFSLTLRFTPQENENIEAEVRSIFLRQDRPDAFLCQTLRQAECVDRMRKELKIPKKNLPIVVMTTYLKRGESIPFPHIVLSMDPESLGRKLGSLLREQVRSWSGVFLNTKQRPAGEKIPQSNTQLGLKRVSGQILNETVPVKLVVPD